MSLEGGPDQNPRPKRNKTELACDTCRSRKSRCDGRRPACSHCENTGRECVYRPPLTSLETDASVLARLSSLETRIAAIDQGGVGTSTPGDTPSQAESSSGPAWPKVPLFHHAAAHKMFHYWSRLQVNMTIPDLDLLHYLRQVDEADTHSFAADRDDPGSGETKLSVVMEGLESMFDNMVRLPFMLRHIFTDAGLSGKLCLGIFRRYMDSSPGIDNTLQFKTQTAEELLLQTVALKHLASAKNDPSLSSKADSCFRNALQQMWAVQSQQGPQVLPFKLLYVLILLYIYGRPFHALGLLQSFEAVIHNSAEAAQQDMASKSQHEACLQQYYILESDILSEIDGHPSQRLYIPGTFHAGETITNIPSFYTSDTSGLTRESYAAQELQAHLHLRAYMNIILENLYILNRAYCRPEDVADVLTDIARRLDMWYWSLPLNQRFPRHPSAFLLESHRMSELMDEIRFRYHAAVFLVNRPVLYSVLYENTENAVRQSSTDSTMQNPWVYESACNCVQNAIMIILLHSKRHSTRIRDYFENWCNLQHLVAAYSIILQVQNSPMSILLQESSDSAHLLDMAEAVLEQGLNRPVNVRETLAILRNIRQNFQRHTPRTPSVSNSYGTSPGYSIPSHQS